MTHYWVITPYDSTKEEIFNAAWAYDYTNNTIAIGWTELGDVSKCSKEELTERVKKAYQDRGDRWLKYNTTKTINALWNFYHEISIGDIIIARKGLKKMIGFGEVSGRPYYSEKEGERRTPQAEYKYSNFIKVSWTSKEIDYDEYEFGQFTILQITKAKFDDLTKNKTEIILEDDFEIHPKVQEFAIEKYLEEFILHNFDSIFQGTLTLLRDENGKPNQHVIYSDNLKELGRIDILALDPKDNTYVIIELKKGKSSDKVVGQLSRYMGWVKENLCEHDESVRGLIICKEKDKKLEYALKVQPNMNVKFYTINFKLKDE